MRTTDRLTLGLINFCSQRLSTWVVGSYPQVELLVYLKHDSVLWVSLVLPQYCYLSVRNKLDRRCGYNAL